MTSGIVCLLLSIGQKNRGDGFCALSLNQGGIPWKWVIKYPLSALRKSGSILRYLRTFFLVLARFQRLTDIRLGKDTNPQVVGTKEDD